MGTIRILALLGIGALAVAILAAPAAADTRFDSPVAIGPSVSITQDEEASDQVSAEQDEEFVPESDSEAKEEEFVPEPGTAVLLGAGLVLLAWHNRRRGGTE